MPLHWTAVDLNTSAVTADFPSLEVDWPLRRTIGAYDTTAAKLPWKNAPENWLQATKPLTGGLVCYDTDDPQRTPLWGGYVVARRRGDEGDFINLDLSTIEGYFQRRYVRTVSYAATGQNEIVEDLLNLYVVDGARPGIQLGIVKLNTLADPVHDRQYFDQDDATVYARLTELMGIQGGPEWTTEWQWADNGTALVPVLTVGARLGSDPPPGVMAPAFNMPGCVTSFQYLEDYSEGKGANAVIASGSGQGDVRPQSAEAFSGWNGSPQVEFRWTPSTSISDVGTLNSYATQAVGIMNTGSQPVTLRALRSKAPKYGSDWVIGDTISYNLAHQTLPSGLSGAARAVAYELYRDEIAPILAVPSVVGA